MTGVRVQSIERRRTEDDAREAGERREHRRQDEPFRRTDTRALARMSKRRSAAARSVSASAVGGDDAPGDRASDSRTRNWSMGRSTPSPYSTSVPTPMTSTTRAARSDSLFRHGPPSPRDRGSGTADQHERECCSRHHGRQAGHERREKTHSAEPAKQPEGPERRASQAQPGARARPANTVPVRFT